ncbi:DNA-dependent ATPase fun30 [Extremus antarcticus]|uniref:DNA helicase n=1 Tax=Extremus antarcticus TaxID=702011 RepID=A0AAJ0DHW4_9PEZI|nr:DNA-dependent ATPase fun30 [Extremus antarcticus]
MADDPISSDATPHKRRKLNGTRGYDSQNDSGDEFTAEDFETAATLPRPATQRRLEYTAQQLHADLNPSSSLTAGRVSSPPQTFVTQPTQPWRKTQPTQPLNRPSQTTQTLAATATPRNPDVLVGRSSPTQSSPSPKRPPPEPLRRAPFARPGGLLGSALAPPGTTFRRPLGVQQKPTPTIVEDDESDDDDLKDPPLVVYSDDEETQQGVNLKPTNFRKGGRGLDSTPNRGDNVVKESPKQHFAPAAATGAFSSLMKEFNYSSSPKPADDMISAYGSSSRSRPVQQQTSLSRAPKVNGVVYKTLDDIQDYVLRYKVTQITNALSYETVQRCVDALRRNKGHVGDAIDWLTTDEEQDAPGEEEEDQLASTTPAPQRGVAYSKTQSSQPVRNPARPAAKQEIRAPVQTIAEKYGGSTQAIRRPSQIEDEPPKPRKRLQQGRKPRSPSPASSPVAPSPVAAHKAPQPLQRSKKQTVVISDDDASDSGIVEDEPEVEESSSHDQRLLEHFNTDSVQDLADLSAQPEATIQLLVSNRPFASLDEVREFSVASVETKSGKKSKARPIGEKIVDTCSEVWTSYDAIDELVKQCEDISRPIQDALKGWGFGTSEAGELELMNLDSAHDSGVGTPASSCPSDDAGSRSTKEKRKGQFLGQPSNMNSEATMKDYQLVGLNWLNLLWTKRISCILADDMGLGKTCQIISFLAQLQLEKVDGCALVIVPGSTLENWLREFKHFAPSLSVQPYYGSQKERQELQLVIEDNFGTIDVVVTTYDMAVKKEDNYFLRKRVDPLVCIYDEAHVLRNPKSDRYRQLTRFNSDFRVLLTGTPVQNNLRELIAILAFIMPEMFSEKKDELDYIFQHKATTKDPTENPALLSSQRIAKARTIITPFILRRKKHQVLDLPTKLSRVQYCDMTDTQHNYYIDLQEDLQKFFHDKANARVKGSAKQSSNILMDLRKAAMHPLLARRLYDDKKIEKITDLCLQHDQYKGARRDQVKAHLLGESANSVKGGDFGLHLEFMGVRYLSRFALKKKQWMDSGKVAEFRKLITGFAENGDRVLVFSQFTTMMNILEAVLETDNIKFLRLDGSTDMQNRQEMIDTFYRDESITVFMLSTRAGGAGINLAAANKVIIFDSGFNPQDDIQAENRAHRVGQTREVEVIRLVTRGTIEEQIYALGKTKLKLDDGVAGEGATAEDSSKAEKVGQEMVVEMLKGGLKDELKEKGEGAKKSNRNADIKDMFKVGLESAGVKVGSKQAQF